MRGEGEGEGGVFCRVKGGLFSGKGGGVADMRIIEAGLGIGREGMYLGYCTLLDMSAFFLWGGVSSQR